MFSKRSRLILEVGCGNWPLPIARSFMLAEPTKYEPRVTLILDEYADLTAGDEFICIDKNEESIKLATERLEELAKQDLSINKSRIVLKFGNGAKLSFADKSVDVVAFNDVFSAPYPGATPCFEPYPEETCISDKNKRKMIREALRVLKDGGVLFIGIHLTPCYATKTMEWIENELVKTGRIQLIKQCGEFVGRSDNWHLYQVAFQKMPAHIVKSPEVIPWTERQREYIREYAASWDDLLMY